MKILIVGGNGTIGKKVSSFLSKENEIITAGRNSGDLNDLNSTASVIQKSLSFFNL